MTNTFISTLDRLGGPKLAAGDVEWVADLSSGKGLLDFLALQTHGGDVASSLRDIALEKGEVELWHQALQKKLVTRDPPSFTSLYDTTLSVTPLEYTIPSIVRSRLSDIEEEQALLDRELRLLDGRIRKARSTNNAEKRMDKTVSAVRNRTFTSISHLEEQLSEISERADSTISSTAQCAFKLASELIIPDGEDGHHSYQRIKALSHLLNDFAAISSDLSSLSSARFERDLNDSLTGSHVQTLRSEVHRLARSIRELEDKHIAASLEGGCDRLEHGENWKRTLSMAESSDQTGILENKWVEAAVAQAWSREQAADLRRKTEGYRQITNVLRDELLPPLALTYASLSVSDVSVGEAHVAIQALVDELDDAEADLDPAEDSLEPVMPPHDNDVLEERAKDLLKQLRGSRATDLPPLVLTERADVLSELSDARSRYDHANAEVSTLCTAISSNILSLDLSSQIYLSALTAHSPVTTAPPISVPLNVQQQVTKAKAQIAEVSHILEKTPHEFEKDSRARRKLDSFVENYGR